MEFKSSKQYSVRLFEMRYSFVSLCCGSSNYCDGTSPTVCVCVSFGSWNNKSNSFDAYEISAIFAAFVIFLLARSSRLKCKRMTIKSNSFHCSKIRKLSENEAKERICRKGDENVNLIVNLPFYMTHKIRSNRNASQRLFSLHLLRSHFFSHIIFHLHHFNSIHTISIKLYYNMRCDMNANYHKLNVCTRLNSAILKV